MKKFLKRIDWKKFWKYQLIAFLLLAVLYANSVMKGRNIFPENIYTIFLIPTIFAMMLLLHGYTDYRLEKSKNEKNTRN